MRRGSAKKFVCCVYVMSIMSSCTHWYESVSRLIINITKMESVGVVCTAEERRSGAESGEEGGDRSINQVGQRMARHLAIVGLSIVDSRFILADY